MDGNIWKTRINFTAWKVSVFEVFLVCIFPHLNWIRRDNAYLSVFSPKCGKYGPVKLRIQTLFTHWFSKQILGRDGADWKSDLKYDCWWNKVNDNLSIFQGRLNVNISFFFPSLFLFFPHKMCNLHSVLK